MAHNRRYVVIDEPGIACPRCGRPTQVREHPQITTRLKNQPFFYRRWFNCMAGDCRTTLIMRDEFKVWNDNDRAEELRRLEAVKSQLNSGASEWL